MSMEVGVWYVSVSIDVVIFLVLCRTTCFPNEVQCLITSSRKLAALGVHGRIWLTRLLPYHRGQRYNWCALQDDKLLSMWLKLSAGIDIILYMLIPILPECGTLSLINTVCFVDLGKEDSSIPQGVGDIYIVHICRLIHLPLNISPVREGGGGG